MSYLLDTNVVIALLRNQPDVVRRRFADTVSKEGSVGISSVVLFELRYGVARSTQRQDNAERLRILLSGPISVTPFEEEHAVAAGDLRATLESAGRMIGPYDLLIGAQALASGAILVTANVSEFARVPGLVWEDWTVEA